MNKYLFILLLIFILPVQAQYNGVKPMLGVPINWAHPFARGLVGCWLMNEGGGGLVNDHSGNRNTGAFVADTAWVPGPHGMATYTDGSDAYITINDHPSLDLVNQFTLVCCVKQLVTGSAQRIIFKHNNAGAHPVYGLQFSAGNVVEFITGSAGSNSASILTGTGTIPIGWHQIVGVYGDAAAEAQIYIDGQFDKSGSMDVNPESSTGSLDIGHLRWSGSSYYGNLKYSYVFIYNRALTVAELRHLYQNPFCMFEREHPELYVSSGEEPTTRPQVIIIMSRLMPFIPLWVIFILIAGFKIAERDYGEN